MKRHLRVHAPIIANEENTATFTSSFPSCPGPLLSGNTKIYRIENIPPVQTDNKPPRLIACRIKRSTSLVKDMEQPHPENVVHPIFVFLDADGRRRSSSRRSYDPDMVVKDLAKNTAWK